MCKKSGIFNSNNVPTYRTRIIAKKACRTNVPYPYHHKKAYRTNVLYLLAKIEAYRTVPTYRTAILGHQNGYYLKQAMRKNCFRAGIEPAAFGLPVHCSTIEMARITKNASACCAASANFVRMLHHTAFKHN